jgi:hypothetical protein
MRYLGLIYNRADNDWTPAQTETDDIVRAQFSFDERLRHLINADALVNGRKNKRAAGAQWRPPRRPTGAMFESKAVVIEAANRKPGDGNCFANSL